MDASDTHCKATAADSKAASVRRSHKIVELLAGRFFDGVSNKELAQALGTHPVNICRDLEVLAEIGYVKKLENGRWALTARPLGIMQAYTQQYETLQTRMNETTRSIMAYASQTRR